MVEPLFFKFNAVSSLANGSISGSYATILSSIPSDIVCIIITTTLDGAVMLSFDGGTTDHLPVPKATNDTSPIQIWLASEFGKGFCAHSGSALKVKTIDSLTAGSLYISVQVKA